MKLLTYLLESVHWPHVTDGHLACFLLTPSTSQPCLPLHLILGSPALPWHQSRVSVSPQDTEPCLPQHPGEPSTVQMGCQPRGTFIPESGRGRAFPVLCVELPSGVISGLVCG